MPYGQITRRFFYYLIFIWRGFYELIGRLLWFINLKISFFSSNLIFWYQSLRGGIAFNKILASLSDIGCAWIIFKIIKFLGRRDKLAKIATAFFLLLPSTWYNSAFWGQDESLYCLFILLAFFLSFKNYYLLGTVCLGLSALIKPISLFAAPAFLLLCFKEKKITDLVVGLFLSTIIALILYFPFLPLATFSEAIGTYMGNFRGELTDLVANAFNFWALIYDFEPRPSTQPFF